MVTYERVREVLVQEGIEASNIGPNTSFVALDVDSLEFVELCQRLEEIFGIEIPDEKLIGVNNLRDLCNVINDLRTARHN